MMMKLTLVAIALFVCAVSAQDAAIHATYLPTLENVWNTQYLQVENLLNFPNIITDVSFTVFASKAPKRAKIGFSFPGNNNYYGSIGAIVGHANGTGSFSVNGQAGTYELTIGVAWLKNGKRGVAYGKYPYTIVSSQREVDEALEANDAAANDIVVEFNNVESGFAKRDGNSTDLGGTSANFAGYANQVTWNQFGFKAGSTALFGLTFTFTPSNIDQVGCSNGNNTKQVAANGNGAADFTIYGSVGTYTLTVRADYRKGSAVGTKGSWFATYGFTIVNNNQGTSLNKKSEVKSIFDLELDERQAESNGVAKSELAVVATVAGVACVAAVAVVAAIVTIRRRKQSATLSA